jgi:ankyrin repeat protein
VVDFLIGLGADASEFFGTGKLLFVEAVTNVARERALAEYLIARNVSQVADGHGTMPIHAASRHRNLDILRGLIDRGAEVNARDRKGLRPLHHAVEKNAVDVCVFLIENGAELDATDRRGRTPLHTAAALGYLEIVELLCDYGANACAVDPEGCTPVVFAHKNSRRAVSGYFASLGLDVDEFEKQEVRRPSRRSSARMGLRGEFPPKKTHGRVLDWD